MQRPSLFNRESVGNFASGFVAGFLIARMQASYEATQDNFEQRRWLVNLFSGLTLFVAAWGDVRQMVNEEEKEEKVNSTFMVSLGFMTGLYVGQLEVINNLLVSTPEPKRSR